MEREKEVGRLVRVLRQIALAERFSVLHNRKENLAEFNARQYNRILARLIELEPSIKDLFIELADDTPSRVIRLAACELAEYFAEDFESRHRGSPFRRCRKSRFFVGFGPLFDWRCR
jgi:hypothetical protein